MGQRVTSTLAQLDRLRSRLDGAYQEARAYKLTHDQLCAQLSERVWKSADCARLPQWARSALRERSRMRLDLLYEQAPADCLVWQLYYEEAPMTFDEIAANHRTPEGLFPGDKVTGSHVWKSNGNKFSK